MRYDPDPLRLCMNILSLYRQSFICPYKKNCPMIYYANMTCGACETQFLTKGGRIHSLRLNKDGSLPGLTASQNHASQGTSS